MKMLKKELIELLNELEDESNIDEVILSQGFAKPIDLEGFKELLANNETIKGYHTSLLDSAVSKGVESFKTKTMPKHIEDAIKKQSNVGKTPEQLKIEELETKYNALEKEKSRVELSNKYTKTITEKGLDAKLIDFCFDDTEEGFNAKLDTLSTLIQSGIDNGIKSKIDGASYVPPTPTNITGKITWEMVAQDPSLMDEYYKQQ